MAMYGYARVSTIDQDYSTQQKKLHDAGCSVIRCEKVSANSRNDREELQRILDFVCEGDTLVVTKIDRLARSLKDLQDILFELREKGANLKATDQPIDTNTAAGEAFLNMLGVFAQFETRLRKERQLDGIERAKALGKYTGRKPTARRKKDLIIELKHNGTAVNAIAKKLSISRSSIYRVLRE